ncbi:MAG: ATP-binding cassette domain-containing protein [Actinomycetota bacterium]|nr:MAG: cobalt/nickel transport system ATP-binding [Actinomycetota bacterium]MDO8949027.1 ATP-binding cassette domain-containing protein [Actinomycetota bacterium]MDP3630965.1 ATP-binding cassette domain-containing protein [Actinomycetota bacterium]
MIVFEAVSFTYPGAARPAIADLTLTIASASLLAVVGANGSGKSTLARLADGLLVPDSGRVMVDGIDTADEQRCWDVRSRVGLVLQNPDNQIVGTVVEEDVAFGPENLGVPREELRSRVSDALAVVGLTGLERREPHLLSEGQKQRLAIAGALAMRPEYLVLDEPTAMLDQRGRTDVLGVLDGLKLAGRGVVHITQDTGEAARADLVLALDAGSVAYLGHPAGLLGDASLMAELGLEAPPIQVIADELRRSGFTVPEVSTAEELVEALWR